MELESSVHQNSIFKIFMSYTAHNGAATHTSLHTWTHKQDNTGLLNDNTATSDVTTVVVLFSPLILGGLPLPSQHCLSVCALSF